MSFKTILSDLEEKTGIKVVIIGEVHDRKVSLDIKSLPLYSVSSLLQQMKLTNYSVVFDTSLSSLAVYVLPEGMNIAEVVKGKPVIFQADFAGNAENIKQVKGSSIVSKTFGKNKVSAQYIADEVLIKFHLGVTDSEIGEILKKYNLIKITANNSLEKLGYIKVKIPDGRDVIEVIKKVRQEYSVKTPEPNYVAGVLTAAPLDPLYKDQWYIPETKFNLAWEKLKSNNSIKVAVLDSGVNQTHPDLQGKILPGYDFVNLDYAPSDDNGHGTFISGIIAANANDIGIKGMYDFASIIPVKVIDQNGIGTYEDVAAGIVYSADQGAKVINLSIGGYGFSFLLQDAVDYALEKGCILVAAGGNDGINQPVYPAAYPDVFGVAALAQNDFIWPFSNSGRHIDMSAPGENVISLDLDNNYVWASGTSASSAMVSSLAAIIASERKELSSSFVKRLILQSASDLGAVGRDDFYGAGKIDGLAWFNQEITPFHDIAVEKIFVESKRIEKNRPMYVGASIKNVGTYNKELCDVVLYKISGESKIEIGRKKKVVVHDKLKIFFESDIPEGKESFAFQIVTEINDEVENNNSRSTDTYDVQEQDGIIILYSVNTPVHQWIAFQAYNKLPSSDLKNEIAGYLPTTSSSDYYSLGFKTSEWSLNSNSAYPSSTALIEGAWEEDQGTNAVHHFWDPDGGYNDGIFLFDSALTTAATNFNNAITTYSTSKAGAYYWLGRTAHLLMDMSVPAHVQNDQHMELYGFEFDNPENYEWYYRYNSALTGYKYKGITSSSSNTTIPNISELSNYWQSTPYPNELVKLFYNLSNYTDNYDSDDINGDVDGGRYNHFSSRVELNYTIDRAYSVKWYKQTSNGNISTGAVQNLYLDQDYEFDIGTSSDSWGEITKPAVYLYSHIPSSFDEKAIGESTYDILEIKYYDEGNNLRTETFDNLNDTLGDYSIVPSSVNTRRYSFNKSIGYVAALYQLFWDETQTGAPSSITVPSNDSDGSYEVSWGASSSSGVTYVLEEATDSSFTSGLRTAYTGTQRNTAISERTSGNTYYYRVKASGSGYIDSPWRTGSNGCYVLPTYTVSYNANSATSGSVPASQTKTHDVSLNLRTNSGDLARTGYSFAGWNTNSSGTGTHYAAGGTYSVNASDTLYAEWEPITYTVSYNANGATGGSAPSSQTKTYGIDLTLRTNSGDLARMGYTFNGWNTNSSGTGTHYAAGGSYTVNTSDTLYAEWVPITYTINYNANGATSGSIPSSQTKAYGIDLTLRTNSGNLERTGYTFVGWNTSSSGAGTHYAAGGTYYR